MRGVWLVVAVTTLGCGGAVDGQDAVDAASETLIDSALPDARPIDAFLPPSDSFSLRDGGPVTLPCDFADPLNPPILCGPTGAPACSTTSKVDSCPLGNACMAPVKQTPGRYQHRIGRLRLWAPEALLSLTSIAFDPNVNAKCANSGSEAFSWLLDVNRAAEILRTGSARASSDGATFSFLSESFSGSGAATICPGFVGPTEPLTLAPITTTFTSLADGGFRTPLIPNLNIAIFDSTGAAMVLPLREVLVYVPKVVGDGTCIGSWDKKFWCDGDSLGWTTGGSIVAKILVEEANRVPVRSAGCQSLCAILVNDATKTDGKICRRGADGKVPEIGNTCIGGVGCKNAWLLSTTFASYGVTIK